MNRFCHLEKDQKTYKILQIYISDIRDGKDIFRDDQELQVAEIKDHNTRCGEDKSIQWVERYAYGYRIYLNSIKELALLFLATKRGVSWDNYCYFVDQLNTYKNLIEKIY
jgi:hypothetical protein